MKKYEHVLLTPNDLKEIEYCLEFIANKYSSPSSLIKRVNNALRAVKNAQRTYEESNGYDFHYIYKLFFMLDQKYAE